MAKKNNYVIYGDDDRAQVEDLDEIAKGLDELIYKERERQIKKRLKKRGKKKTVSKNNVNYVTPVKEELLDINDDIPLDVAESTEKPKSKEKEVEKEEPKKKVNWPLWILTACLAIIVASIGTVLYNQLKHRETQPIVEDQVAVVEDNTSVISGGRLIEYVPTTGDDVNTSLVAASNINSTIESYYGDILEMFRNYSQEQDLTTSINDYKQLIQYDILSLDTYRELFSVHDGLDYFNTSRVRFENLHGLLDSYSAGMDKSTLYTIANNFIRKENGYGSEARQALIYFLDRNNVYYNDDSSDHITYEELSISGDSEPSSTTPSESLEIEGEVSQETEETVEPNVEVTPEEETMSEVPSNSVKPKIWIYQDYVTVAKGSNYDIKNNIMSVTDDVDGNLPWNDKIGEKGSYSIETDLNLQEAGEYKAHMVATDSSGNTDEDDWIIIVK